MANTRKNVVGQKFGLLSVLHDAKEKPDPSGRRAHNRYVLCQCDCGRKTSVRIDHLRSGKTRSCGCFKREVEWEAAWAGVIKDPADHDAVLEQSRQLTAAAIAAAAESPFEGYAPGSRIKAEQRHDLPPGTYAELLALQDGVCAICREPPGQKPLVVDHHHETNVVRGLLCSNCNSVLGYIRECVHSLARAIQYLTTPTTAIPRGAKAHDRY